MMRFLRLIEISRPISWILFIILFLIGIRLSDADFNFIIFFNMVVLILPYCFFLFGINDYYDYESDKLNPRKKKKFIGTYINKKELPSLKKSLYISLIPIFLVSLLTLNIWNILFTFLLVFFSYAYSAPPFRFKEIPVIESVSNAIIIYLIVILGFSFNASPWELTSKAYYLLVFIVAYHIFSTIMDYESDKKAGHKTFAVRFGKRTAAFLATTISLFVYFFAKIQSFEINLLILSSTLFFAITFVHAKFAKIGFYLSVLIGLIAGIIYLI